VSAPLSPATPLRASPVTRVVVLALAAATLLPGIPAAAALLGGIAVALTVGDPFPDRSRAIARRALAVSVVGLGAGMDLVVVGRVGLHGLGYTAAGITVAFVAGTALGRWLAVAPDTSLLVTVGTAICGGSAIAAVAPVIGARSHDVSMALVTVFLLNAVALLLFPVIGHLLALTPHAFGLWCALAIHDTSSVVAASAQYGPEALQVATAAKLARALWIVPVTFAVALHRARSASGGPSTARPAVPWFIGGFVAAAALVSFVPALRPAGDVVSSLAHRLLVATLFGIGLGLSRTALRSLGPRPFLQGVGLWLLLGSGTLAAILAGWIT
jgi:uncharacterized integral membrane protein (TIGR00698 family)